jgi:hypothetical protein
MPESREQLEEIRQEKERRDEDFQADDCFSNTDNRTPFQKTN